MLRFELERAHKFEPQHLGGAHDEQGNGNFLSFEAPAYEDSFSK
jgi:hypothetical protein